MLLIDYVGDTTCTRTFDELYNLIRYVLRYLVLFISFWKSICVILEYLLESFRESYLGNKTIDSI